MKKVLLVLSIICLLVAPIGISAQTKRALVIGLGEQKDKSWPKINGDKDASIVKNMLLDAGYKEINTLVNKKATKARIVKEFQRLASRCCRGDVICVYYAGHGQQVTDIDGDEVGDEWDESWIPYDAYAKYGKNDRGEKHLIDDEVNVMLTAIREKIGVGGKLLVVVDACYSGGSVRDPNTGDTIIVRGADDKFRIPYDDKLRPPVRISEPKWLTLSACCENQLTQEKDRQIGLLTYALDVLSKKGMVSIQNIEQIMDVKGLDILPQNPVLTGETETSKLSDFFRK